MTTQPKAERLADALEHWTKDYATTDFDCEMGEQAAAELRRLVSFNQQLMDEVSEQCRINGMSAEREDALRAEVERLNKAPDYAWPTIADYEKEVGLKVNDAFRMGWAMARTTNGLFKQMGAAHD